MEGAGVGGGPQLSMDCEDMFKEITKKLYGEEAAGAVAVGGVEFPAAERAVLAEREYEQELRPEEHITAWGLAALMQKGFPPPGILQANFAPRTDPTAEDRWTAAEEPLAWAQSRVASYNPAQRLFKCAECECVGFLSRVAEHWLGTHSNARVFHCPLPHCSYGSSWARCVRAHLARDHDAHDPAQADALLRDNPALDELTRYLQRLKNKVEANRGERRTGETVSNGGGTGQGGAGSGVGGGNGGGGSGGTGGAGDQQGGKRYACAACPYATDRRDLFTRHENIHRDEKPFHCYLCTKQFNRADHVKKHFLRMHRDHPYDLNRIRRQPGVKPPAHQPQSQPNAPSGGTGAGATTAAAPVHFYAKSQGGESQPAHAHEYRTLAQPQAHHALGKGDRLPAAGVKTEVGTRAGTGGGGAAQSRRKGERRYACCYCAWSGVDNWCLKRHLNTHLKPFACALCEYKAARAERLATHVHKVHNKKACARCPYLADDQPQLAHHLREQHHIESRNIKVPSGVARSGYSSSGPLGGHSSVGVGVGVAVSVGEDAAGEPPSGAGAHHHAYTERGGPGAEAGGGACRRREGRAPAQGAARLFGYLEASDGSGDEYEPGGAGTGGAGNSGPQGGAGEGVGASGGGSELHHFQGESVSGGGGSAHHMHAYAPPAPQPPPPRDKENAAPAHHQLHHEHCLRY